MAMNLDCFADLRAQEMATKDAALKTGCGGRIFAFEAHNFAGDT